MRADLLLCDHAEAVNGKLYINGGGWNLAFVPNRPFNMFLAILVRIDWDETNVPHEISAELRDDDGNLVENGEPAQPVRVSARMEVGRPPGIKPGTSINAPLAVGFQNLVLEVGGYVCHVNRGTNELARQPFQVAEPIAFSIPGFPFSSP